MVTDRDPVGSGRQVHLQSPTQERAITERVGQLHPCAINNTFNHQPINVQDDVLAILGLNDIVSSTRDAMGGHVHRDVQVQVRDHRFVRAGVAVMVHDMVGTILLFPALGTGSRSGGTSGNKEHKYNVCREGARGHSGR